MMRNIMQQFSKSLALLVLLGSFSASAWAQPNPVTELNSIADQLISKLKANQATLHDNPSLVYSLANSILLPHADIGEMAKRVLPPKTWNSASSSQRQEFERQFSTLLVHTYASALANYKDQVIHFNPVRGGYEGKSTVEVTSSIERPDGPPVRVSYRLVNRGSEWKLYDMNVEGISMLASFRSQFADQLAQGDINSLIQTLKNHNSGSSDN
jgi:phospholipid transport system substrate-binding protein